MRINSPYITGSATITGNLCVQGTILGTITGVASTASYAETLDGLDSTQFVQTGSFNSYTSSASSSIGSLSGSVATTTSGLSSSIGSLSSSVATNTSGLSSSVATTTSGLGGRITTIEGNYATTGSNTFIGNQVITGSICSNGNIVTTGQIVAQTINVQQVTSSIVYSCGSNIFGTSISNTQQFTGSILATGSLTIAGPLSATTIYGSTAVCSPVGKFTSCVDAGSGTFSGALQGDYLVVGTTAASSGGVRLGTQVAIRARNVANTANIPLIESTASDGVSVSNGALILTSTGAATFSSTIISNVSTNALNIGNSQNSVIALSTFGKTSTSGYATANNYLQIGAGENATSSTRLIGFGYSITANTNQPAYIGYIETSNAGETKGSLIFGTRDVTTDTAPTTRLTIASTGDATLSNTETTLNFNPQTNLLASYYYLNFGGGSIMYRNTTDIYFGSNSKYNSAGSVAAIYTSANGMGLLTMDGGNLRFQATDTSVTAGTVYGVPIRFAINGDGNIGIGTTSPSGLSSSKTLNIYGGAGIAGQLVLDGNSGGNFLSMNAGTSSGDLPIILFNRGFRLGHATAKDATGYRTNYMVNCLGYSKMSPDGTFVNGNNTQYHSMDSINDVVLYAYNRSATGNGILSNVQACNTSYWSFRGFSDSYGDMAFIYSNGTFGSRTGTYGGIVSDARCKTEICDASSQWSDIKNLRVRNFKLIEDVENDPINAMRQIGFIAQEVETVSPGLVFESGNGCVDSGCWKNVKTSIIHTKAVKALQEAMCRIEILESCLGIM